MAFWVLFYVFLLLFWKWMFVSSLSFQFSRLWLMFPPSCHVYCLYEKSVSVTHSLFSCKQCLTRITCAAVDGPYEDFPGVLHLTFLRSMKMPGQNELCTCSCHPRENELTSRVLQSVYHPLVYQTRMAESLLYVSQTEHVGWWRQWVNSLSGYVVRSCDKTLITEELMTVWWKSTTVGFCHYTPPHGLCWRVLLNQQYIFKVFPECQQSSLKL